MRAIDADELNTAFQCGELVRAESVKATIDHMPTIEEQKTGKWKERKVYGGKFIEEWQSARCSVCGKYHTTPYMYYFDEYKFCPNCGADMRGGQDDNRRVQQGI